MTESLVSDLLSFRTSDRFDAREKAALAWTEAIALDATIADEAVWAALHEYFSEPELVELGFFIALTLGQQRWIKTLDIGHGQVLGDGKLTGVAEQAQPG